MSSSETTDLVIADRERLRGQLVDVVDRLDHFTAELLAEVAAHRTPPSTEDDPSE
jgi:hypothetical protein